jgi:predicted RNase H-like HicB family nuclease
MVMGKKYSVVIERDEDGFLVADVPELDGCHTQAKTMDVLIKRVKEVIALCEQDNKPSKTKFVGVQMVELNA